MNKVIEQLELLYAQMGKPSGTNLFAKKNVISEIGESVTLDGIIIPAISVDTIREIDEGNGVFRSNIYLSPLSKEEFEKEWLNEFE